MSFKLLAIRPLTGCNRKFLKNLEENRIYKFYNDYKFYFDSDIEATDAKEGEITKIEYKPENAVPNDLFGKNINISAIVGKNGSGKSALVELFVACLNQFSLFFKTQGELLTDAGLIDVKSHNEKLIECEIFYIYNNSFFALTIKKNIFNRLYDLTKKVNIDENKFLNFFYTIIVNYSIYSFNTSVLTRDEDNFLNSSESWLDELFHKNDSYQIPIVINPKREETDFYKGMIDMNNEQELLNQRLLLNLLTYKKEKEHLKLGDNRNAVSISIILKEQNGDLIQNVRLWEKNIKDFYEPKKGTIKNDFWNKEIFKFNEGIEIGRNAIFHDSGKLLTATLEKFNINENKIKYIENCYKYIIYKIFSICQKYPFFKSTFLIDKLEIINNNETILSLTIDYRKFLEFISKVENRSHITNKLMQVINYLKFYDKIWKDYEEESEINILKLAKKLNYFIDKDHPLIEMLPPPIFHNRVLTEELIDHPKIKNRIFIEDLSSGEQQLIHSVSSILYHLNNLESVKKNNEIVKYKNINLIFDEIELYFHPEFQRKLVKYLLDGIINLKHKELNINILFITHSPFILSDIPKQNVLFLEVDEKTKKAKPSLYKGDNTFGENIHQILTGGFFISDTKGAFVSSKIKEFLKVYNRLIKTDKKSPTFTKYKCYFNKKNNYFIDLINLIGEDYVRNILKNHLVELQVHFGNTTYLDAEEVRIRKRLEEIKKLKEK